MWRSDFIKYEEPRKKRYPNRYQFKLQMGKKFRWNMVTTAKQCECT